MEGSLYPNGVLVDQAALRRTETTKANQIQLNRVDLTSGGVVSGGTITASGTTTGNFTVAPFAGYTPRGDYINSTSGDANESLDDVNVGIINYVYAIYTETNTKSQPHETDGTSYPTYARGSYTLVTLTAANYALLSATDDNLSNYAQDRCLLLGKITATGSGTLLTAFEHPTVYDNILYSTPNPLTSITGVEITSITSATSAGTGTVTFTNTGTFLQWTAPGGAIGSTVAVGAGGTFTIVDATAAYSITVEVITSLLPSADTTEIVTVYNLYHQDVPRLSAEDTLHRTRVGTGTVTAKNAHGLKLDDLGGGSLSLLDEHQDVMHSNGIWSGSDSTLFDATLGYSADDTITLTMPGTSDIYYVNGIKNDGISTSNALTFDTAFFTAIGESAAQPNNNYFELYVDDAGALVPMIRAKWASPRDCAGTCIIDMYQDHTANTYELLMVKDATYFTFTWDGGNPVAVEVSSVATTGYRVLRLYRPGGVEWIDLCIGHMSSGADEWLPSAATGTFDDDISVIAAPDLDQHMKLYSFPYMQATVPALAGHIGYPIHLTSGTKLVDHRVRGNIGVDDISDTALNDLIHRPTGDHHASGVLNNRTAEDWSFKLVSTAAGLANYRITGGEYYSNGQKLTFEGATTAVPQSVTTIFYIDRDGTLQSHPIGDIGTGTLAENLYYILGSSFIRDASKFEHTDYVVSPYMNDRPQLGTPLVMVTADATTVTDLKYISRAVGPHVEPWSVADRSTSAAAEYHDLYTAFAYANYLGDQGADGINNSIEVRIVGDNSIDSGYVVQPTNVNVIGNPDSNAIVTISSSDTTGAWRLSAGNKVEGVQISYTATTNKSVAMKLAADTVVERCNFTSPNTTLTHFLGGAAISGVRVLNNRTENVGGLFSEATGVATGNGNWKVDGNYINVNNPQAGEGVTMVNGMLNLGGVGHIISNNYIVTENVVNGFTPAVNGTMTRCSIEDNVIAIGIGDLTTWVDIGIYLFTGSYCKVSGNKISGDTGTTDTASIGILVGPTDNTVISNEVTLAGIGIMAMASTSGINNLNITSNSLTSCVHRGIQLSPLGYSMTNVSISGNTISDLLKLAIDDELPAFGSYFAFYNSLGMAGIEMYQGAGVYDADRINVNITNNVIRSLDLRKTAGINMGILYTIEAKGTSTSTYENLNISNNVISDLISVTGVLPTSTGIAFYFGVTGSTPSIYRNVAINNNNISLETTAAAQVTTGILVLGEYISAITINDNVVTSGYPEGTITYSGIGITANIDSSTSCMISGNSVVALWEGITCTTGLFSVMNNNVTTYSQGIVTHDAEATIVGNNVVIYSTANESSTLYDGWGSHGITLTAATTTRKNVVVKSNTVKFSSTTPTVNHAVLQDSAALYIGGVPGVIQIESNTFTNTSQVDTVTSGSGTYNPSMVFIKARAAPTVADYLDVNFVGNTIAVVDKYDWTPAGSTSKINGILIDDNGTVGLTTVKNTYMMNNNTIRTPYTSDSGSDNFNAGGFTQPLAIYDMLGPGIFAADLRNVSWQGNLLMRDHILATYATPKVNMIGVHTPTTSNLREQWAGSGAGYVAW